MYNEALVYDSTKALSVIRNDADYTFVANRGSAPISDRYEMHIFVPDCTDHKVFLIDSISTTVANVDTIDFEPTGVLKAFVSNEDVREKVDVDFIYNKETIVFVDTKKKFKHSQNFKHIEKIIQDESDRYVLLNDVLTVMVQQENLDMTDITTGFKAISIDVENGDKIESQPGVVAGGSLEEIRLTAQLQSFVEFYLKFKDKPVDGVIGLPPGMEFNKALQKIVGSPKLAGDYIIKIIFEDDSILKGKLMVPKVKRDM